MVIISMTMTLKILFISKLWLSVIDINNIQRVKKKGQRINVYSMACNKSVRLVYDKR